MTRNVLWSPESVCLSVCGWAACLHYCTDPDVTWESGRGCPLVVHQWYFSSGNQISFSLYTTLKKSFQFSCSFSFKFLLSFSFYSVFTKLISVLLSFSFWIFSVSVIFVIDWLKAMCKPTYGIFLGSEVNIMTEKNSNTDNTSWQVVSWRTNNHHHHRLYVNKVLNLDCSYVSDVNQFKSLMV